MDPTQLDYYGMKYAHSVSFTSPDATDAPHTIIHTCPNAVVGIFKRTQMYNEACRIEASQSDFPAPERGSESYSSACMYVFNDRERTDCPTKTKLGLPMFFSSLQFACITDEAV